MKASPAGSPASGAKESSFRPVTIARAVAVGCFAMSTLAACGSGGAGESDSPEAVAAAKAAIERHLAGHDGGGTGAEPAVPPTPNDTITNRAGEQDDRQGVSERGTATSESDGDPKAASTDAAPAARSVDTLIDDMDRLNDLSLKGVDAKYGFAVGPGHVIMGNDPRGTNTPDWYQRTYPWMATKSYWNYLLPWFVQFEGEGNKATNTRVEMKNMKVFVKSRATKQWAQVNRSQKVGGIQCDQGSNYFHCPISGDVRTESEGTVSSLPTNGYNLHGWWGSREYVDGSDIAAVVITLQARLAVDAQNGVDDRSEARYLIQVGADYYPSDSGAETVLPAVGISRAKLLTTEWQSISMTTLSDVGKQEPGGGITAAELRDAPPPLD